MIPDYIFKYYRQSIYFKWNYFFHSIYLHTRELREVKHTDGFFIDSESDTYYQWKSSKASWIWFPFIIHESCREITLIPQVCLYGSSHFQSDPISWSPLPSTSSVWFVFTSGMDIESCAILPSKFHIPSAETEYFLKILS